MVVSIKAAPASPASKVQAKYVVVIYPLVMCIAAVPNIKLVKHLDRLAQATACTQQCSWRQLADDHPSCCQETRPSLPWYTISAFKRLFEIAKNSVPVHALLSNMQGAGHV